MERSLYIENFRNIGVGESQKLVLNRSIEKGKSGNLIILIGENNAGKSNVLDALEEFGKQALQDRDRTTLNLAPDFQTPQLTLVYKVNEGEFYRFGLDINGKIYPKHTLSNGEEINADYLTKQIIDEFVSGIQKTFDQFNFTDSAIENYIKELKNLEEPIDAKNAEALISSLVERVETVAQTLHPVRKFFYNTFANNPIFKNNPISDFYLKRDQSVQEKANSIKAEFKDRFGFELLPNVYRYRETQIRTAELSKNQSRQFIDKVLRSIDVSPIELDNVYDSFKKTGSRGILTTEENKLNNLLKKISDQFNTIYYRGAQTAQNAYSFKLNLESNNIFFSIFRGDHDINLDYQSTGFKWFFNLYFNLLCGNSLKAGDIIIMDEPATNLHIGGQIELRKFLKEFAIANELTLILATHSPFLIDLDYLDEIRLIALREGSSYIHNDFTTVSEDDPDTLEPIKRSLTVNNHILLDPDVKVVFVEGITDYNYMTAFKNILGGKDIVFMPINGVGNPDGDLKKKRMAIIKSLQRIKKHCPILMVDGDAAGKGMKEFSTKMNSELKVFSLDEVDPAFKTIETLFSDVDAKKFDLTKADGTPNKHSSTSSALKTFGSEDTFSKSTMNNFKKLFNYIEAF